MPKVNLYVYETHHQADMLVSLEQALSDKRRLAVLAAHRGDADFGTDMMQRHCRQFRKPATMHDHACAFRLAIQIAGREPRPLRLLAHVLTKSTLEYEAHV